MENVSVTKHSRTGNLWLEVPDNSTKSDRTRITTRHFDFADIQVDESLLKVNYAAWEMDW